ncbi:addiction module antitoxin [Corynebacterium phocae]|uniref:Addiction module antitoxin n=1 Tax=Corynebacterium phocae TaxID=161895 RepID=A0A1L7D5P0_9CORY|nr:addiction module antidote protein [Corynebacterium phocae]APT93361.1 addiction module antitoxin [Corynebacterium phocae]KAA8721700.1 putative addiction module antidote protein [Corynebacterium phocae]
MNTKVATRTRRFDASEYLDNAETVREYLAAALEDGDPRDIQLVLRDIAKAQGMSALATKSGLNRESLYKSLSAEGNPSFATILRVMEALGLKLTLAPEAR